MSLPSTVVALLTQEFGCGNVSDACAKAHLIAKTLKELLEDAEDGVVDVTREEDLELIEEEMDPLFKPEKDDVSTPGKDFVVIGGRQVERKVVEQAIDYYRSSDKGTRCLTAMSNRFRWIRTKDHLGRLREYEEEVATRLEKLEGIKEKLLSWVLTQMEAGVSLHDWNLRHQALQINRDNYNLTGFVASQTFLKNFIVLTGSAPESHSASLDFVQKVKDLVVKEGIPESAIFNGDQSGFVKEQHSSRSLAIVGQKAVFRAVGCVSATTHSSTILPQVSAAGALRKKICVVLQEPGGKLPAKGHFQADNLTVFVHSSHIMTKGLMVQCLKECVFTQDLPPVSLLILDSWPPFTDHQEILKHAPPGKKVHILNIPPGCTSKIQPLDVYFFIHVKKFMKRVSSHVQLQGLDFPVHRRDDLLKTLSQVFWVFAHQRFSNFLVYSWSAAGYVARPPQFETLGEYAFASSMNHDCQENGCTNISFILCPYCQKTLCFTCFFIEYHRC